MPQRICDADDKPLRRFIHWSDARSGAQTKFLKENYSELLRESSVNSVSPAWTLPQMMWLRENEPEVIKSTRRVYFAKDYVRHRITGDFCTDSIEAMGAMLCNDHTSRWVPELCELAGVSADMLPEIKQPGDIAGFVLPEIAAATAGHNRHDGYCFGGLRLRRHCRGLRDRKACNCRPHMPHNRRPHSKPPVF